MSVRHVPDSEGEEEGEREERPAAAARNERGKSPFEHVVDMTKRAFAPATFYLRQRSLEPSADGGAATNGHNASYDYSAEEREFQSQKPISATTPHPHKKGRISLDNKAYRPSASDLDDSGGSDDDDDGRKVRRRKTKKREPHGGPLTTLPTVAGHDKKRRRKGRGSKGNAMDIGTGEEEEDSTGLSEAEHISEQVCLCLHTIFFLGSVLDRLFLFSDPHQTHEHPNNAVQCPSNTDKTIRGRSILQQI